MAYARYVARGRGGILIPIGSIKFQPSGGGVLIDLDARYVTARDIESGSVIIAPDATKEFEAYDPEREVVFLLDDGKGIHTYRGAAPDQPSPRELYERQATKG
jgi:hypothetical protein